MSILAIFGVSALMSLVSSGVIAQFYVWPRIRNADRGSALIPLLAPHMFLRFIGLSFLVPGVVSSSLPAAFAVPAAYGDFVAGLFAIVGPCGRMPLQHMGCSRPLIRPLPGAAGWDR